MGSLSITTIDDSIFQAKQINMPSASLVAEPPAIGSKNPCLDQQGNALDLTGLTLSKDYYGVGAAEYASKPA